MIQLIVGNKGKGKTKHLLDKVNTEIKDAEGNVVYLDSFLQIACLKDKEIGATLDKLETVSAKFNVNFVLSISVDESELPENLKSKVIVSL